MGAIRRVKTKRRTRDLDQVHADLRSSKHLSQHKSAKPAEDLPGLGQWYCVECAKWFESEHSMQQHTRGKNHKRRYYFPAMWPAIAIDLLRSSWLIPLRVRMLKEEPYSQKEADAAIGLLTDNGTRKPSKLFGGAITANFPASYADVSNIREVPDHQEIYLDASGFSSVIVEIAERVSQPPTDHEALKFHFEDIVDEHDTSRIWHTDVAQLPHLPPNTPCYTLLATTTPSPAPNGNVHAKTPSVTAVMLTLIRLVAQSTDIVVTVNIPHIPGHQEPADGEVDFAEGKFGSLVEEGVKIRDEVWRSLEVRDWGLFGGGGDV